MGVIFNDIVVFFSFVILSIIICKFEVIKLEEVIILLEMIFIIFCDVRFRFFESLGDCLVEVGSFK